MSVIFDKIFSNKTCKELLKFLANDLDQKSDIRTTDTDFGSDDSKSTPIKIQ